jgi:hypothetical protein
LLSQSCVHLLRFWLLNRLRFWLRLRLQWLCVRFRLLYFHLLRLLLLRLLLLPLLLRALLLELPLALLIMHVSLNAAIDHVFEVDHELKSREQIGPVEKWSWHDWEMVAHEWGMMVTQSRRMSYATRAVRQELYPPAACVRNALRRMILVAAAQKEASESIQKEASESIQGNTE